MAIGAARGGYRPGRTRKGLTTKHEGPLGVSPRGPRADAVTHWPMPRVVAPPDTVFRNTHGRKRFVDDVRTAVRVLLCDRGDDAGQV